jgi:saccharopine dehydrogenase-like NADP-dependent oxidoreductase
MIGAMMFLQGKWKKPGVFNVEEFDRILLWNNSTSRVCPGMNW